MKKKIFCLIIALVVILSNVSILFAGSWEKYVNGWKYKRDDGTYVVNGWEWIDTNQDSKAECFCFDAAGYMYVNTVTPDGSMVNANGEWVVNGVVQQKDVVAPNAIMSPRANTLPEVTDYNIPGSSSSEATQNALNSFKLKCQSYASKLLGEGIADVKENSWSYDDIALILDDYNSEVEKYLDQFEIQVDVIVSQYNLPRTRKDRIMSEAIELATSTRSSLRNKLSNAMSKYNDD